MASTIARKSLRMHAVRLASHLAISTRPERRLLNVTSLSSHRRVLLPSPSSRRELSVVRVKRGGMDGEGEASRPGASGAKIEEQVVVDSKKIEQVEKPDEQVAGSKKIEQEEKHGSEAEKESDDEEEEEVESRVGEWFRLSGTCSLVLHRGDITKWYKDGKTDAVVNAANERMLGGGGVDGAIHRAAGKGLFDACFKVPEVSRGVRCPVGSAVITPGFNLPVSQVIHTVGPMYYSEGDPASVLAKAYKNSASLAVKSGVKYIAFPAISCGVYGYPYDEAAEVSIKALQDSAGQLSEVHFVLFEADTYSAWLAEAEEKLERLST
ncbi:hypothetical protein M758_1G081600 [Ceratodon purpureus]|nr:hypothetical protein M758_1G081600 [Ceratodon purpureus]